MGRIVAIDYGKKRFGLAATDPMRILASPLLTIEAGKNLEETVKKILAAIPPCDFIIVGLPLLLSGKDSETTLGARLFAEKLKEISGMTVELVDERFTSKEVDRRMMEDGISRKKRSLQTDRLSAVLLLQSYLARSS
ncbi:MAG: Holliday junction resolvase RuvX [Simkaniaceae bacterium]|nr:Holliday junction resolvase RuvX [Simkaniaceae bacterium]